jgi:hypothetical protein
VRPEHFFQSHFDFCITSSSAYGVTFFRQLQEHDSFTGFSSHQNLYLNIFSRLFSNAATNPKQFYKIIYGVATSYWTLRSLTT